VTNVSRTLFAIGALGLAAAIAAPTAYAEKGDWLLKGGATMVSPKSNNLNAGDLGFIEGVGTVTNVHLDVDDATSFGFTITYMMTDNWGVELLAAVPFSHDIKASATIDGTPGTIKIGKTDQLPPTLSLQYHFMPDSMIKPYVGAGINYTTFSSEKIDPLLASTLTLDDSFGVAAQIGADIYFADKIFVNADVRWIQIESTAKVDGASIGKVKINPFVYSLMIGYKF